MRRADQQTFSNAASRLGSWILVRESTDAADHYRARADYVPRPISCVAPAADFNTGRARVAGLVVDAAIHPGVFSQRQRGAAVASRRFYASLGAADANGLNARHAAGATPYSIDLDPQSPQYGSIQLGGRAVYDAPVVRGVIDSAGRSVSASVVAIAVGGILGGTPAAMALASMPPAHVDEPILAFGPGGQIDRAHTASELSMLMRRLQAQASSPEH